ncbi:MAG TPA: transcription-repair coupling factor, partial [Lacunisphaera sp.]|nr:transcription-repair coupling factor [Lacunisphaera sp.]
MPSVNPASRTKLTGICPAAQAYALAELLRLNPAPVWLLIHEESQKSAVLAEDIALFHAASPVPAKPEILTFPEAQTGELREAFHAASDRLAVLSKLRGLRSVASRAPTPLLQETLLVLTTPAALRQPVPPLADFATRETELVRGETR